MNRIHSQVSKSISDLDWFLPAIQANGSLSEVLKRVGDGLAYRQQFIGAVHHALCHGCGNSDQLTSLKHGIQELTDTLSLRLGMLSPQRPAAWFRRNHQTGSGPFGSKLLSDPVFASYDNRKIMSIRYLLKKSFMEFKILGIPFHNLEPCLWLTLLSLNQKWHELNTLPPPFEHLQFDSLPTTIPEELATPALHAFLKKVAEASTSARIALRNNFDLLWTASEAFWSVQQKLYTDGGNAANASSNHQEFFEDQVRSGATKFDINETRALQFMCLSALPSPVELKRRYHELARVYHPDVVGGSSERFSRLSKSYKCLEARLKRDLRNTQTN